MMHMKKLAVLVVALVVLMAGCAAPEEKPAATPSETTTPSEAKAEVQKIPIGVLIDLSGPLVTYGQDIKNTLEIAKEDINKYFEEKGKPYRVEFYYEDTRVDPKLALDKVMALHGKGVKLVIGPMGSGEVKNILQYVSSNKIIIISPSSTTPPKLLGITKPEEKKYVFRFVATDTFQTKAIAKVVNDLGIKAVVIAHIGNAWGKGLDEYGKAEFEKYGIVVREDVEYPDPPPADFTPYIATLENAVNDLLKEYDASEIAVVAFSYEEVATMLAQVSSDSPLLKVKWIGCDGCAKSSKVLEVADKANKVKLYSTLFESKGEDFERLSKAYQEKYGGSPYQYALNAYDAAWVLALAYAEVYEKLGKYDADEMAKIIPEVTEKYCNGEYGVKSVSGFIKLDEFNDRASGDYAIYCVENGEWIDAGLWKYETNEIIWK